MSFRIGLLLTAATASLAARGLGQQLPAAEVTQPSVAGARVVAPAKPEFGTKTVSFYRVGAFDFVAQASDQSFGADAVAGPFSRRFAEIVDGRLIATPHLPGGALLTSLELDDCDTNLSGHHLVLDLYDCDYHGECNVANPSLVTLSSANNSLLQSCGFVLADLSALNYTVDNNFHQLTLVADFESGDITNQLAGVTFGYQLQVSPDPPGATFTDVPVNHPFHRFVEALFAAGITSGYPDGRFGVNDPVTRGEMAVFLSVALGLNWSQ